MTSINILFIGDVVGRSGRKILKDKLPLLKQQYMLDFVFCNGENAAGGLGITADIAGELLNSGIDGITLGNHIWSQKVWLQQAAHFKQVCRPLNAPDDWPGFDHVYIKKDNYDVLLISLMGQAFIKPILANPFQVIDRMLSKFKEKYHTKNIIIDFHAESTAEKITMGYFLENKVLAVLGTHTHVQTADEQILGNGTAFITDIGMTGPANGVLGMNKNVALEWAMNLLPATYDIEKDSFTMLNAVLLTVDPNAGQAKKIERIQIFDHVFA
ncbi:MAG TPA: TIGR00282 family metallophosphoesterase [Clostridiaceae bacterium]|nr:TIGR00282 family metallophosphoesterase [Clostridiaceae bacterium]